MPYKSNEELPDSVRNSLPDHGQDIYRKAFNTAWEDYKNPEDRKGDDSREEVAHKVAWSAVNKEYHKEDGQWVRGES